MPEDAKDHTRLFIGIGCGCLSLVGGAIALLILVPVLGGAYVSYQLDAAFDEVARELEEQDANDR